MKISGLDRPITVEPAAERVTVRVAGRVLADTTSALRLQEASYPPVYYVPIDDVDETVQPYPAAADIAEYVAFYPDRVELRAEAA